MKSLGRSLLSRRVVTSAILLHAAALVIALIAVGPGRARGSSQLPTNINDGNLDSRNIENVNFENRDDASGSSAPSGDGLHDEFHFDWSNPGASPDAVPQFVPSRSGNQFISVHQ